ncbi:MAG: hypothetical protein LBU24_06305 [Methanocalculaceae archaeon]|jgi:hypothetical protein|nr:hypothetical protein [Methanocalculaceae archaeon]
MRWVMLEAPERILAGALPELTRAAESVAMHVHADDCVGVTSIRGMQLVTIPLVLPVCLRLTRCLPVACLIKEQVLLAFAREHLAG